MSSNGNVGSNSLSNDIDLNYKRIINLGCEQDIIKVLEEGLKEISERLYSMEATIEKLLLKD